MADPGQLEERTVEVNDPKLSADANRRLTDALRETLGTSTVTVPTGRTRVSEGQRPKASLQDRMTSTRAMAVGTVCVALGVAFVVITALGKEWLLTGVAFAVLVVSLAAVVTAIMGLASVSEYPDPSLVAYLSELGVRDPEVRYSELVHEFTPVPQDPGHRTAEAHEDPALAAAEQTESITPSSGPSRAVGPGGE